MTNNFMKANLQKYSLIFFLNYLFEIKRIYIKLCQICHFVPTNCYHIELQNSCQVQDFCNIRDNITFNVSSILRMYDSKFFFVT